MSKEINCCSSRKGPVEIAYANRILKANIPVGNGQTVELIGRSWAADSTAFVVPSLDIALDAGYPVYKKIMRNTFITHCHTDHIHHLTHYKDRKKPPTFYVPEECVALTDSFLHVSQQMTSFLTPKQYEEIDWQPSYHLQGVQPGDRLVVHPKRGLHCEIIACDHGVPCVGYGFSQVKQRLREEFSQLPGREIGKLRKEGVQVTQEEEQKLFCFLGDTTASILDQEPQLFSYPTIIIECTFLTDDCRQKAHSSKHVLWSELLPHVERHPETTFVLTHFSHRWTTQQVADFFAQQNLPNVIPWVPSDMSLYCQNVNQPEAPVEEIYNHSA